MKAGQPVGQIALSGTVRSSETLETQTARVREAEVERPQCTVASVTKVGFQRDGRDLELDSGYLMAQDF